MWDVGGQHTAISRKVVGKNVHATNLKGNMGYNQYTVPDDCSCWTYFCCFPLAMANKFTRPYVPILSNFCEKKRTQNHPQCLSGLSRALFPTTFLEIAVYPTPTGYSTFKFVSLLGIRQGNERQLGQSQGLLEKLKEYSRNLCQLHAKPQTIKQSCLTVDNSKQNDIAVCFHHKNFLDIKKNIWNTCKTPKNNSWK